MDSERKTAAHLREHGTPTIGAVVSGETHEAGWYPDPWGTEGERYYDGVAWARSVRLAGGTDGPPEVMGMAADPVFPTSVAPPMADEASSAAVIGLPPGWFADPWRVAPLRFWDGDNWTGHVSKAIEVPSPELERDASRWARIAMLWAGPALAIYAVGNAFQAIWIADNWDAIVKADGRVPDGANELASTIGQLAFFAFIAAAVLFLMWFHRSAVFAAGAGLPARRRPRLVVGSFFIPVVNLWWPYQSACDLLPPGHPGRSAILRWWLLCIGSLVAGISIVASAFLGTVALAAATAIAAGLSVLAAFAARAIIDTVVTAHADLAG